MKQLSDEKALAMCIALEDNDRRLILNYELFEEFNLVHERIIWSDMVESGKGYVLEKQQPLFSPEEQSIWVDGFPSSATFANSVIPERKIKFEGVCT